MAASWVKVNPDEAFDSLPQPYRSINDILNEILDAVGEQIDAIAGRRRSAEYEFALRHVPPTASLTVVGGITCAHAEQKHSGRLVLGTSHGEVVLVDTAKQQIEAQMQACGEEEAVHRIALVSDGMMHPLLPAPPTTGDQPASAPPRRVSTKVVVAGSRSPRIRLLELRKDQYGTSMNLYCEIRVSDEPTSADATDEGVAASEIRTPVEQLHVRGTYGGLWVVALLNDRSVRCYLCPLAGHESNKDTRDTNVAERPIIEEDEEQEEQETGQLLDSEDTVQICTPTYCIALGSLATMPGYPEPNSSELTLSVFSLHPDAVTRTCWLQVPTYCFVTSRKSNVIQCYGMRAIGPTLGAPGRSVETILTEVAPQYQDFKEPDESKTLEPLRRWSLPAKMSAVAVSPNGGIYAVGDLGGAIALASTAAGPALDTMLPGHYATVRALAFHGSQVLVSAGEDAWVHHYCMKTHSILARNLCTPPPTPPPVSRIAVSQAMPLAFTLDVGGHLRLIDLKRGCKIARPTLTTEEDQLPGMERAASAVMDALASAHGCLFATGHAFVVLGDKEADSGKSRLFIFELRATLCNVLPGLAERVEEARATVELNAQAFFGMASEEPLEADVERKQPGTQVTSQSHTRFSLPRAPSKQSQRARSKERTASKERSRSKERDGSKELANSPVAELTEENLRRMGSKRDTTLKSQAFRRAAVLPRGWSAHTQCLPTGKHRSVAACASPTAIKRFARRACAGASSKCDESWKHECITRNSRCVPFG